MRSIPSSLQEKINKVNQTIYEKANPQMGVQVRRAKTTLSDTDLFYVETIREKAGLQDISVALLRLDPDAAPSHVYEIHNDNGIIKTTIRDLKDFREDRWKHQFDVGSGKACSIEFDGYWIMDLQQRYNLITEEKPYIFWTDNANVLYVQKWDDFNSRLQLSTDVVKVSSIRGWKSVVVTAVDQGLICAYIKNDGKVYYRNYAQQEDSSFVWETEKEITAFTAPVQNIGLFRTNDYRTGFIAESNSNITWALTARAWAGMATPPENISAGLTDYTIVVRPIEYTDTFETENLTLGLTDYYIGCAMPITPAILSVSNTQGDNTHIKVKFTHPIAEVLSGRESAFTLKDSNNVTFVITSTAAGADQTEMILTTANFAAAKNPMTLTYNNGITVDNLVPLLTTIKDNVHFAIESGNTVFTAAIDPPKGYESENLSVGLTNYTVTVSQVFYRDRYDSENLSAGLTSYSIVVTKVGSNPL